MPRLFHQNMLNFGGCAADRLLAYGAAFNAISGGVGPVLAAGFTEILNDLSSIAPLSNLAQVLDRKLTHFILIAVGDTAARRREYIGIAYNPDEFKLEHAGNVLKNPVKKTWEVFNTPKASLSAVGPDLPTCASISLPVRTSLTDDERGVAYVGGKTKNGYLLIGFMHNQHSVGSTTTGFSALPTIASRMRVGLRDENYRTATVHIGGDFNVNPRPLGSRPMQLHTCAAVSAPGGAYVITSKFRPYDFWVTSDFSRQNTHCAVHTESRVNDASDHAGISLILD